MHLKHELQERGIVGRVFVEPDLAVGPLSRVEVLPPNSPFIPHHRIVEHDFRGAQTSPLPQRRAQYRDQDTAGHLRNQTTKKRSIEHLDEQSPALKGEAYRAKFMETHGINDRVEPVQQ